MPLIPYHCQKTQFKVFLYLRRSWVPGGIGDEEGFVEIQCVCSQEGSCLHRYQSDCRASQFNEGETGK